MFDNIDLKEKITSSRDSSQVDFDINSFHKIIEEEIKNEKKILSNLSCSKFKYQNLDITKLDVENIYDIKEIKETAIKYRLRFLPSKHYKKDLPIEAILKIKEISKKQQTEISNFMILAPAKAVELEDENADPLLFIALSKSKYYLVHQWGNDLKWYNQLKAIPLTNLRSMLMTIGLFAAILALITPTSVILSSAEIDMGYWGYHRVAWFLYAYILFISITTFLCFSQSIYPSDYQWNKKTYN